MFEVAATFRAIIVTQIADRLHGRFEVAGKSLQLSRDNRTANIARVNGP
jgi:hypothetical protein